MDRDFSIDDILAEVDKKRSAGGGNEPSSFGVTEIIETGSDALIVPRKPRKPEIIAEPEPLPEPQKPAKKEKPVKIKKEKPAKEKPAKTEKPEKVKKGDIVFTKAVVTPKLLIEDEPAPQPKPIEVETPSEETKEKSNRSKAVSIGNDTDEEFEFPKLEITQVLEKFKPAPMDEALKKRDEALLERDMALEKPLEQISALNPYDMLNYDEEEAEDENANNKFISLLSGDTKGIADGDLKELAERSALSNEEATAEVVKTYIPATAIFNGAQHEPVKIAAKKEEHSIAAEVAGHLSEKAKRSNTALIESLNRALKEKRDSDVDAYRTITDTAITPNPDAKLLTHGLNIDYKKQILTDTSLTLGTHPQLIQEKLKELKGKRKRKIRDFVLEDIEDDKPEEYYDEADSDYNEYDDYSTGGQIWSDLCETHKGLRVRFLILLVLTALATVVAVGNDLGIMNANVLGMDLRFLDKTHDVTGLMYLNLILGIAGIITCASVVKRGFAHLFTGKADCDSICAVPAVVTTLSVIPMLNATGDFMNGLVNVFVAAGLAGLLFNTTGKLMMMARAKRNFGFISGDSPKYYAEIIEDEQVARAFTKGVMYELPVLCTARKTEFLTDFLKNSYVNDKADQLCRYLVPAAFAAALAVGLGAMFIPCGNEMRMAGAFYWALTAANATLCMLSPLSIMFLVNNPLLRASKALAKKDAIVLGYNSAEKFSKVNSVLVDAQSLFPAGSVDFRNLKRCQQPNSLTTFAIDDAIITAASLAIKSGSILTSMFFDMLAGKSEMLYPIDNCIYEVNMGISGWMGNKRVMLGNRDQMKHHGIKVPDLKKESEYSRKFGDVVYLASGGETIAMFFLKIVPNEQIKRSLQALQRQGISIVVRTRDSLVTSNSLAEAFELLPENLRVIPFDLHAKFDDCTKYASRGDGSAACSGTFSSFTSALVAAKKIMQSILLSSSSLFIGLFLAAVLCVIFTVFAGNITTLTPSEIFSSGNVLLFNAFFFVAMMAMQGVKRY